MKLICNIGSVRLKNGSRVTKGEEFELRGKEAHTLLDHGYAIKASDVAKQSTDPPDKDSEKDEADKEE